MSSDNIRLVVYRNIKDTGILAMSISLASLSKAGSASLLATSKGMPKKITAISGQIFATQETSRRYERQNGFRGE